MRHNKVKLFTIEEHHEAFYVWKFAVMNNLIKHKNNTLLHIDEHSDMGAPQLNSSIHHLNGDLSQIKKFTYRELSIATFIVPAIHERLFNKVYWIKQRHNSKSRYRGSTLYTRSVDNAGKKIIAGRLSVLKEFQNEYNCLQEEIVPFQFYKRQINELSQLHNVLLDIDLDYFSCIQDPLKNKVSIEVTKEEYESFVSTPYHRVRFFDFGRVDAIKKGARYYYVLNGYEGIYKSPLQVSFDTIIRRIEDTISALKKNKIRPSIITVCRSRFSGYTPNNQWEFIEQHLIEKLSDLYDIESMNHISEI